MRAPKGPKGIPRKFHRAAKEGQKVMRHIGETPGQMIQCAAHRPPRAGVGKHSMASNKMKCGKVNCIAFRREARELLQVHAPTAKTSFCNPLGTFIRRVLRVTGWV